MFIIARCATESDLEIKNKVYFVSIEFQFLFLVSKIGVDWYLDVVWKIDKNTSSWYVKFCLYNI